MSTALEELKRVVKARCDREREAARWCAENGHTPGETWTDGLTRCTWCGITLT